MTHIEFVGQSPWTLMAVSVAVAAIYYIAKKVMASNNIDEVPPRPNPPRDPFIAVSTIGNVRCTRNAKNCIEGGPNDTNGNRIGITEKLECGCESSNLHG